MTRLTRTQVERLQRRAVIILSRTVLLAAVWLILTGATREALVLGVAVVPCAVWLSLHLLPAGPSLHLLRLLALLPGFVRHSVMGGFDVAWRAFHPRLPINPGWVEVPVDLPDGGKVALGAELSLMPGTLVAGSDGPRLLLHMLDRDQDIETALRAEEKGLAGVIGMDRGST